jgi:DnaJ-class molecular chaperone
MFDSLPFCLYNVKTMQDLYQTLGVNKNATPEEIKQAYRRLAMTHHPDRGGDEKQFQEIKNAYEVLSDPVRRQQHDNPGPFHHHHGNHEHSHFEFHFGGGGPQDIFAQFFNQGFGAHPFQRQPRKNKDLRVRLGVDLASTLQSQEKTISVQTTKGDRFTVDVSIPRGIDDGTTIKFSQLGDNFFDTLTRGDLYVIISVNPDPRYEIAGNNLITQVEIDSLQAMLGLETQVTGIDGRVFAIKIPQGCQYGTRLGLQGQGLYQLNSHIRGDLIVDIRIKTPVLNEKQLELLRQLQTTL